MDSLVVDPAQKPPLHLASVFGGRPLPRSSRVDRDDAGADPQDLPAQTVIPLTVVGGIREDPIPVDQLRRLPQGGVEAWGIIAGAVADVTSDPEIGARMAQNGQLRPEGATKALRVRPFVEVMKAGMTDLKAGGVDRAGGLAVNQAEAASVVDQLAMDSIESPFFRSRF